MPKASTEKSTTTARKKSTKSAGGKTAYQRHMKKELAKLKESHPKLTHNERFKMAATNWKKSPDNPNAV